MPQVHLKVLFGMLSTNVRLWEFLLKLLFLLDGPISSVLQEVALPIISNEKCEEMFFKAGHNYTISDILICAGYEKGGKDTCNVNHKILFKVCFYTDVKNG